MALIDGAVAVTCQNPRCEATWGVRIRLESTGTCDQCGAMHEMDDDGYYWMLDEEAQS